jgi:hypothetical protein
MMALFDRDAIKNLKIYPVRGNHDCYFKDNYVEINLSSKYPKWVMPDLYYSKMINIGRNGEKLALVNIDSCLLMCKISPKYSDP